MRMPFNSAWLRGCASALVPAICNRRVGGAVSSVPASRTATASCRHGGAERGSVLIIVLWVAFGLVSLAIYFANSSSLELRAADNRLASIEAEQAIAGAARYVSNVLATTTSPGMPPNPQTFVVENVSVGDATFWLIGQSPDEENDLAVTFGLVDESSKLNLNTATAAMLEKIPRMTPELAAAVLDWRDSNSDVREGGAEDETYARLNPPYRCKNAPFESITELRLVYGFTHDILFDEDANLNAVLDQNENDEDATLPADNHDGVLNRGVLAYVTVHSREPNTRTNGDPKVNVATVDTQALQQLLSTAGIETARAQEILRPFQAAGGLPTPPTPGGTTNLPPGGLPGVTNAGGLTNGSVLEFFLNSGMTEQEFALVEADLTVSTNTFVEGLVNVNTATETVLTCIPGIGAENAGALVAHRAQNTATTTASMAWVTQVLARSNAIQAGPFITGQSYVYSADIAAVGRLGRGYQRVQFIFDTSEGGAKIRQRQDLTHLGWALGPDVRRDLEARREER